MVKCCVYPCDSATRLKLKGISFHKFPENEEIKSVWLKNMHIRDWRPTPYSRICSKHFEESCFQRNLYKVDLRFGALPTIFPTQPQYLQVNVNDETSIEHKKRPAKSSTCRNTAASSNSLKKNQLRNGQNNQDASNSDTNKQTSQTEDQSEVLGKHVASKARQLEKQQRMFLERIIYEAIFEAQMGNLNVNSKLIVNTKHFISGQYDDKNRIEFDKKEDNLEKETLQIEDVIKIEEPEYLLEENSNNIKEPRTNLIFRDSIFDPNTTKTNSLEEPAEMSQKFSGNEDISVEYKVEEEEENANILGQSKSPEPLFEDIPIKVEIVTEEDILGHSDISDHPIEDIPIKQEVVAEDESSPGEARTEFVINKQLSSIEVVSYRSSNAKRKRSHEEGEATIHLEVARR